MPSWFGDSAEVTRLREQNLMLNARALAAEGALDVERARYDALFQRYDALRQSGANVVEPPSPRPANTADVLEKELATAVAGLPFPLRRAAVKQLRDDRLAIEAGFLTEDDVLRKMRRGVSLGAIPDGGGTLEEAV